MICPIKLTEIHDIHLSHPPEYDKTKNTVGMNYEQRPPRHHDSAGKSDAY